MNKRLIKILLPLLVLIVSGCVSKPDYMGVALSGTPPPASISSIPIPLTTYPKTSIPTLPPIPTQPTHTPTASCPNTPETHLGAMINHIESIPQMSGGQATGALLLSDYSTSKEFLLDLSTGTRISFDLDEPHYCNHVAPNRLQIICSVGQGNSERLLILNNTLQVVQGFPLKDNWNRLEGWLNNNLIMLSAVLPPDYPLYRSLLPTTVFNLVTNEEVILLPDYPDISDYEPFGMQGPLAFKGVSYSPNLNLVIYKSWNGEQKQTAVVLWDREHNKEVVRIPDSYSSTYPQWHPVDDRVVVVGSEKYPESEEGKPYILKPIDDEIFILSVSEQSKQVTHLGELFDNTTSIYGLGWSPDGRRIAFDLEVNGSECGVGCIGILDLETGEIHLVNFPNYRTAIPLDPTYALVWSPDSRQLVLDIISMETDEHLIIIYDVERKIAFKIATQARIEGWLIYP